MIRTALYKESLLFRRRPGAWLILAAYALLFYFLNRPWAESFRSLESPGAGLPAPYRFPEIWGTLGYMGSWLIYLPCMLLIGNLGAEFRDRTYRQQRIHGWSAGVFLASKFLLATGLGLFCLSVCLVTGMALGQGPASPFSGLALPHLLGFGLLCLNYLSLSLLLVIGIGRSLASISLLILYDLMIENLISLLVIPAGWAPLLPLGSSKSLFPNPLFSSIMNPWSTSGPAVPWWSIPVSLIWIGVYISLAHFLLKRRDA